MGNTYHNNMLYGPQQDHIVNHLLQRQHRAFVSPTVDGRTFVYDPDETWLLLAEELSQVFRCAALFVSCYDSDIFEYTLFDEGRRIDHYNSAPDYWDGQEWPEPEHPPEIRKHQPEPSGGDARVLCAAFGADHCLDRVEAILHPPGTGAIRRTGLDAFEQHWAFAEALGWPPEACTADYRYLDHDGVDDLLEAFSGVPPIRTGS